MGTQLHNALFWPHHIRRALLPDLDAFARCLPERLLPTFASVDEEAKRVEQEVWDTPAPGDPEDFDPGDHAERAQDAGVVYYETMKGVEQGLINLYTVGLAHLLEQQLLFIHRRELLSFPEEEHDARLFTFEVMKERLKAAGINIETFKSWPPIEELRVLSNTAKHADGRSCAELKRRRPELFVKLFPGETDASLWAEHVAVYQPLMGEQLYVTRELYEEYAAAAKQFLVELAEALERHDQAARSRPQPDRDPARDLARSTRPPASDALGSS